VKEYIDYESYINHQKEKTSNTDKRKVWLNEEWDTKVASFEKEFRKLEAFLTPDKKCLCLGARTGQEVAALKNMGIEDAIGTDLIPQTPHVIEGDVHNLDFEENTFDFIYTNILGHSIDPKKMIAEVERVLKPGGLFHLQIRTGLDNQDEYVVFKVENPIYEIATLFDQSYCMSLQKINREASIDSVNFAGMNIEMLFQKNKKLSDLFIKYGNLQTIDVPQKYQELWENINLPIQNKKLTNSNILDPIKRREILDGLRKRAYYLTRIAEIHESKNILEVGTAEGWQFFSFGEYAKSIGGKVFSCDPRDVRSQDHIREYEGVCFYHQKDSRYLASLEEVTDIDMFYIDGLHDENTVIADVVNLVDTQNEAQTPVWIFDDFDIRFGCYKDIRTILSACHGFKIWDVGLTGSGQPSHQVMVNSLIRVNR
tara:strand:- start:226 stop:1503 length:1278 start_codon:yes stop_codon:yes gene_type:complete